MLDPETTLGTIDYCELQHVRDFTNLPGVTHLAVRRQYFPGSGASRYFLEVRGSRRWGID